MRTGLYVVIIFLTTISFSVSAQTDSTISNHAVQQQSAYFTISGTILNQADNKPVADASVFLSNTTMGTKTADDGSFT